MTNLLHIVSPRLIYLAAALFVILSALCVSVFCTHKVKLIQKHLSLHRHAKRLHNIVVHGDANAHEYECPRIREP